MRERDWWRLDRAGHGMVLAATGQGKFVNAIAPNALVHEGPLVVFDPKGEIAAVTRRHRSTLGPTVVIDPFEVLGERAAGEASGSCNPFDAISPDVQLEDYAESLAWELSSGHESSKDPFWQNTATSLLAGLIASVCADPDPSKRHLGSVVDAMSTDDVVYGLAKRLDENQIHTAFARKRVSRFLQIPDGASGSTRSCVLVSALQYLQCFESVRARSSIESTSFDLALLREGETPMTIYFVFPPNRAKSHRGLLRVWLSTIFQVLLGRRAAPSRETLLVIDEAANLGAIDQLPAMHSYLRSSGTSILTAWQSLGQIQDLYAHEHRTICENCWSIQVFGLHGSAIDPVARFLGVDAALLFELSDDDQLVALVGRRPEIAARVDYRTDARLRVLASPNPRYARRNDVESAIDEGESSVSCR